MYGNFLNSPIKNTKLFTASKIETNLWTG